MYNNLSNISFKAKHKLTRKWEVIKGYLCQIKNSQGYLCQRKTSQHIMYYPIIFFEIDTLLLGYKKLNS